MDPGVRRAREKKIRDLANDIENIHVRQQIFSALDSLGDPNRVSIVTNAIKEARRAERGKYWDLALELANLAYELDPTNPYFLQELCVILRVHKHESRSVTTKISDFLERADRGEFEVTQRSRDYLTVTLAHSYSSDGDVSRGIDILEKLYSRANNVLEALAELYHIHGEPEKTIELLKQQENLTVKMALWLGKSYTSLSQREKAREILEPFKDNNMTKSLYQQIAVELQQERREVMALPKSRKVWVVHGRDESLRLSIFSFLRSIGLEPIEFGQALASTGKGSPYVGEALDSAFDEAQAVVVLLTGDDEAKLQGKYVGLDDQDHERNLTPQPRPNVIFEAGMAFGRKPEKTILVQIGSIRPISNILGRHILKLDDTPEKRRDLARRLETAGCEVDISGNDWLNVGNFHKAFTENYGKAEADREDTQVSDLDTFKSQFESFLRRLEVEWKAERDSDPLNIEEGKYILDNACSEVVNFRAQIVSDGGSTLTEILDEAARRLKAIQRHQLTMDGGKSFGAFWEQGDRIVDLLKTLPEEMGNNILE